MRKSHKDLQHLSGDQILIIRQALLHHRKTVRHLAIKYGVAEKTIKKAAVHSAQKPPSIFDTYLESMGS